MFGTGARRVVFGSWSIVAFAGVWLVMTATDVGSVLLFGAGLFLVSLAAYCLGRAIDATGRGPRLVWSGRMLALLAAAVAVSFPAVLYGEITMLVGQGRAPTYDIEGALWYEFHAMPLVLVPGLVALRWTRSGAVLFVLDGIVNIALSVLQPFGVIYPEADSGGFLGLGALGLIMQPAFLIAALLLIGSARAGGRTQGTALAVAR
jgi:hypothetical protein